MQSGHFVRWAAVVGAVLLTGACAQATGVAGVSAQSPSTAPATSTPDTTPAVTATIPSPSPSQQAAEQPPKGDDPVKVPPPKLSKFTYAFPVKGCGTTYQRSLLVLPKTTIWAAQGCSFVAPIDGVVDEVNIKNRWAPSTDKGADREGRFVTIIGDDGVRYLGGHLDSVAEGVRPGVRVKAGQVLGRVGRSGNARDTGSNLYFAISWKTAPAYWWVRRGMVEPWDYLDAWLSGNRTLSPRKETLAMRGRLGETPGCVVQCKSKKVPQASKKPRKPQTDEKDEKDDSPITANPSTTPFGQ
ncbi:peptidase M23 [Nonomuraea sp. WAC 01424]|uniref:M23 family metallopeptidase n=1 Tax=Nonomuraea sp. WAC 01424 TaxID=2203200 RepID=UPI000F774974|nr:M23 family metallopeptidase [Nonomuraea sp. WAC 01424]RSN12682.1 peptidase M23 [Nonomuraea sp. WAC 01424]